MYIGEYKKNKEEEEEAYPGSRKNGSTTEAAKRVIIRDVNKLEKYNK